MKRNNLGFAEISANRMLQLPSELMEALLQLAAHRRVRIYAAGGVVRDLLLGREATDLDLVVNRDPLGCGRDLAAALDATLVVLDEEEPVARVCWRRQIDFSGFRNGSTDIVEDLHCRDFTINAMAVLMASSAGEPATSFPVIDPAGGREDLSAKRIRACSATAFDEDPLRLLRAYRFMACLGFTIDPLTEKEIAEKKDLLPLAAPERRKYEFDLLLASPHSIAAIRGMVSSGLFFRLFPATLDLSGCQQPESHHLDVLQHSVQALEELENIFEQSCSFFTQCSAMVEYISDPRHRLLLKWASLFHDLGKAATWAKKDGRITFHNHDHSGAQLFEAIAGSLRWSKRDTALVCRLIAGHMWPFHLNNVFRKGDVTKRACLRLAKKFGKDLEGLFLLAMADSLAGKGPEKPAGMERSLADLYEKVRGVIADSLQPGFDAPPLINGHDLIERLHLTPGPQFNRILTRVRDAQICGEISGRDEALQMAAKLAQQKGEGGRSQGGHA